MNANTPSDNAITIDAIYWDLHALLHGAELSAEQFGGDAVELQTLIRMASGKALKLHSCCVQMLELNPAAEVSK